MPKPNCPADTVPISLADGRSVAVHRELAALVRGLDADGDLVTATTDSPPAHPDRENLTVRTPCCHAYATFFDDELVCRACHGAVAFKHAGDGRLAVRVAAPDLHA